MAYPIGAIAGSLAAIYGGKGNGLSEVDTKYYRDIETLLDNRGKILDFLKNNFRAEISINDDVVLEATIYDLKFKDIKIGIRLDNTMIINYDIDKICDYAYHLVWGELDKIKDRYLVDKENK